MTRVAVFACQLLLLIDFGGGLHSQALRETDIDMIGSRQPGEDGKYPCQVRIYSSDADQVGFCGGSIIGDRWILTAAHCLLNTEAVTVGYGSNDRTKTTKIPSEKIIVHPGYLVGEKTDIALIK